MDIVLSLFLGIGLAAAVGFRVFVPFFLISLANFAGYLSLSEGFQWMGTTPALVTFSIATAIEILAYFIPWLDNALDLITTPLAVVGGICGRFFSHSFIHFWSKDCTQTTLARFFIVHRKRKRNSAHICVCTQGLFFFLLFSLF